MKKAEHTGVYLKLNVINDSDIINRLKNTKNKQGYLKELVRVDIALDGFRDGVNNGLVNVKKG